MKRSFFAKVFLPSFILLGTIGLFYLLAVSYGSESRVSNEVASSVGRDSKDFSEDLSLSSPSNQSEDGDLSCVSVSCVDRELKDFLSKDKFSESINFVISKSLKLSDGTFCHGFMHSIGKKYGESKDRVLNESFDLPHSESCGNGLVHGILEYFKFNSDSKIAGEEAGLICEKISSKAGIGVYNECAHGAGHGFMNSSSNNRDFSVNSCQGAGFVDGALFQCYFGVVMTDRNKVFERGIEASESGMREMASFCLGSKELEDVCLPAYAQYVVDQGVSYVKAYLAFCDKYSTRDKCFGQIALYEVLYTDRSAQGSFVDKVVKSARVCVESAVRSSEVYSCLIGVPGGLYSMGFSEEEAVRLSDEIIAQLWSLSSEDLRPATIPRAVDHLR